MNPFALQVQSYLTQKIGNDRDECEDAIAFCLSSNSFAVADGATEAFGSCYWSRLLVRSWVRHPSAFQKSSFLELVQRIGERVSERWRNKPLPWYVEERAREGAYAAFVGLTFENQKEGLQWRVLAIGDSCASTRGRKAFCLRFQYRNQNSSVITLSFCRQRLKSWHRLQTA